jgi:hypothetical protein
MRQEDVLELGPREEAERRGEHARVELVPAGIEDHGLFAVDDEVLIRLDGETAVVEVLEHDVAMNR